MVLSLSLSLSLSVCLSVCLSVRVRVQINVDGLTGKIRFDSQGVRHGHFIRLVVVRSGRRQQVRLVYPFSSTGCMVS